MSNDLQLHLQVVNGKVRDISPNERKIVVHKGCTVKSGSIVFDGTADGYIDLGTLDIDFSNGATIEACVCFDKIEKYSRILDIGNAAITNNVRLGFAGGNQLVCEVNGPSKAHYACTMKPSFEENHWYHIAATLSPTGEGHIFLDGTKTSATDADTAFNLGKDPRPSCYVGKPNASGDNPLSFQMRSLRLFNRALTNDEILAHKNADEFSFELQLHLQVVDGLVQEASVYDRAITVHKGCTVWDEEFAFDGSAEGYIDLGQLDIDFSKGATIEAWVCFDEFISFSRILDIGNSTVTNNLRFGLLNAQNLVCAVKVGNDEQMYQPDKILSAGQWYHIAATLDNTPLKGKIFVDGVVTNSVETGNCPNLGTGSRVCYVGKPHNPNDGMLKCRMRSLRLYNRALKQEEIFADIAADFAMQIAADVEATWGKGRTSHYFPIDFSLLNGRQENALFTMGDMQELKLTISNASRGTLTVPVGVPSFGLHFRPGTFAKEATPTLSTNCTDWSMNSVGATNTDFDLTLNKNRRFDPGKSLPAIELEGALGDGSHGGSHGTTVALTYTGLVSRGRPLPDGVRSHYFAVLNSYAVDLLDLESLEKKTTGPDRGIIDALIELRDRTMPPVRAEVSSGWGAIPPGIESPLVITLTADPFYLRDGYYLDFKVDSKLVVDSDDSNLVIVSATGGDSWGNDPDGKDQILSSAALKVTSEFAFRSVNYTTNTNLWLSRDLTVTVKDTSSVARSSSLRLRFRSIAVKSDKHEIDLEDFSVRVPVRVGPLRVVNSGLVGANLALRTDKPDHYDPAPRLGIGTDDPKIALALGESNTGLRIDGTNLVIQNQNNASMSIDKSGAINNRLNVNAGLTIGDVGAGDHIAYSKDAQFGIGIQSSTQFSRTKSNFAWYQGGKYSNTDFAPGDQGSVSMVLRGDKIDDKKHADPPRLGIGVTDPVNNLEVNGSIGVNGRVSFPLQPYDKKDAFVGFSNETDGGNLDFIVATNAAHWLRLGSPEAIAFYTNMTDCLSDTIVEPAMKLDKDGVLYVKKLIVKKLIVEEDAWVKSRLFGHRVIVEAGAIDYVWNELKYDGGGHKTVVWDQTRQQDPDVHDDHEDGYGDTAPPFSDLRLKRDIRPITSALSGVERLRGVRFRWTEEALSKFTRHIEDAPTGPDQTEEEAEVLRANARQAALRALDVEQVGLIAQDMQDVLPEVVMKDAEGHLGIDYSRVVALLVEAVKELSHRVEEQAAEIKTLKAAYSAAGD